MRTIARVLATLLLVASPVLAAELVNTAGASKVAVSGYDPVAFFTDAKAISGSPAFTATYKGAVYFFATEEHKKLFEQNPGKYAPQFGGFCAYGASRSALAPIEVDTWQVRNGKLYLNFNAAVLEKFNADFDGNVAKAEKNWPALVAKNGM